MVKVLQKHQKDGKVTYEWHNYPQAQSFGINQSGALVLVKFIPSPPQPPGMPPQPVQGENLKAISHGHWLEVDVEQSNIQVDLPSGINVRPGNRNRNDFRPGS